MILVIFFAILFAKLSPGRSICTCRTAKRKDQKAEFERAWDKKIKLLIDSFFLIFSQNVDNC